MSTNPRMWSSLVTCSLSMNLTARRSKLSSVSLFKNTRARRSSWAKSSPPGADARALGFHGLSATANTVEPSGRRFSSSTVLVPRLRHDRSPPNTPPPPPPPVLLPPIMPASSSSSRWRRGVRDFPNAVPDAALGGDGGGSSDGSTSARVKVMAVVAGRGCFTNASLMAHICRTEYAGARPTGSNASSVALSSLPADALALALAPAPAPVPVTAPAPAAGLELVDRPPAATTAAAVVGATTGGTNSCAAALKRFARSLWLTGPSAGKGGAAAAAAVAAGFADVDATEA